MTTQTQTMHNPSGNAKALKFTDAAGTMAPVYVLPGHYNDVTLNDTGMNFLMMSLVDVSVVPQGGGGPGEPNDR